MCVYNNNKQQLTRTNSTAHHHQIDQSQNHRITVWRIVQISTDEELRVWRPQWCRCDCCGRQNIVHRVAVGCQFQNVNALHAELHTRSRADVEIAVPTLRAQRPVASHLPARRSVSVCVNGLSHWPRPHCW